LAHPVDDLATTDVAERGYSTHKLERYTWQSN